MIIFISSYFQLISIYFQVKEKKQSPQEAAGHNSVPSNNHTIVYQGLLMDYPLEKLLSDVFLIGF